ncbi:hypothetical protein FACS1894103_4860 [Campylobacterota bacterium]|nr:hypothetical protein FACS1894103_4860 [Campylobacterota bacterium]
MAVSLNDLKAEKVERTIKVSAKVSQEVAEKLEQLVAYGYKTDKMVAKLLEDNVPKWLKDEQKLRNAENKSTGETTGKATSKTSLLSD